MFNPYDFANINKKPGEVPDGVIDASDYHQTLVSITDILKNTEYENPESRMVAIMNVVNLFHEDEDTIDQDKVYGVVISCMYHLQTIFCNMDSEDIDEYFRVHSEDIFPDLKEQSTTLPYYDSDFGVDDDE
jgi:hypothetical protein